MEHIYTDYLFILAIYDQSISLDKLLFHVEPGGKVTHEARANAKRTLQEMQGKGLVRLIDLQEECYVRLTAFGKTLSDRIATKISDDLICNWNAQQAIYLLERKSVSGF